MIAEYPVAMRRVMIAVAVAAIVAGCGSSGGRPPSYRYRRPTRRRPSRTRRPPWAQHADVHRPAKSGPQLPRFGQEIVHGSLSEKGLTLGVRLRPDVYGRQLLLRATQSGVDQSVARLG